MIFPGLLVLSRAPCQNPQVSSGSGATIMDDASATVGTEGLGPTHVVGIGASAGGLEALQTLFAGMPADSGACFVVVQHLSADFKSVMAELLAKHTDMPVTNAEQSQLLKPNHVYLIPPRTDLGIQNGAFTMQEQPEGLHLPIDYFFRSMATVYRENAVALVLSGTGSDGSRGILEVKEAGGLILVQDPGEAKFDGMPNSANATGLVDFMLSVEEMPAAIVSYVHHTQHTFGKIVQDDLRENEELMRSVFRLLRSRSGVDFSKYKTATVSRRIERRINIQRMTSLTDYLSLSRGVAARGGSPV